MELKGILVLNFCKQQATIGRRHVEQIEGQVC